jgi:pimeloyl-ACP methyl ester carboxylesterase
MREVLALLAVAPALLAQSGPQLLTFFSGADGSEQPYALYLPPTYDSAKPYPLVVSLHSEESTHRLNFRQLFGVASQFRQVYGDDPRFYPVARDADFIVAFPFARGSIGYRGIAEGDVYDMLADVERRFTIDRDRVYLTGISMGGAGALWYALTRPDVWAAVAPLCAAAIPGSEPLARNLLNLPIRLFHGDQDPVIPVQSSRAWQRLLLDAGVPAEYFDYPGVRHDVWNFAYKNGAIFDWFAQFHRNRFPQRVHFVTQSYRYNSAYWVRLDGLTPGALASIDAINLNASAATDLNASAANVVNDAKRAGPASIAVETRNVDGFTLSLDHNAASVVINGAAVHVTPAATLSFTHASGQWRAGRFTPTGKRPGAEGPLADAFTGRQLYVYGSKNVSAADELDARRRAAERAANWTSLAFPVKADSEVTPADLADYDLILLGTDDTNTVIAHLSAQLPLALNPGAADYGLLFVVPIGRHYAVIASGLPWWTGAGEANRGGDPFAPEPYRILSTFGDYILFKGSLAHAVSEGRFEGNWKVPSDAAVKLRAAGTVTIR